MPKKLLIIKVLNIFDFSNKYHILTRFDQRHTTNMIKEIVLKKVKITVSEDNPYNYV